MARTLISPNVVDRVVTYLDPVAGRRRMAARAQLLFSGGYTGARTDHKALKEWIDARLGSADSDSIGDLPALRARSRDLSRNNPVARGAIRTKVRNIVGSGLVPRPQPDAELLGLDDEAAARWARDAERIWWAWAGSPACDLERRQDHAGLQAMVLSSVLESGDILQVRRFVERKGEVFGLKIQLIEADRIATPPGKGVDPKNIRAGVETDKDGAPVAYYVQNGHPGEVALGVERKYSRVRAYSSDGELMARHLYHRLRPGQTRGIPDLAAVIIELKQLGRYTEAELYAAVIGGMITAWITSEAGEGPVGFEGDDDAEKEKSASAGEIKFDYGAVFDLEPGESVNINNPGRPNDAFDPFVLAILRQIGAALELPFELLVLHFTRSYSSARASLLEAWKYFRTQRVWLADGFCQPDYEWLMTEAVARGMIAAPGFFRDPMVRRAWLECEWRGPAPGQIDPLKEVDAAERRVSAVFSTRAAETAELTGGDFEANVRIARREQRLLRDAELVVDASGNPVAGDVDDDTDETDERDEREVATP